MTRPRLSRVLPDTPAAPPVRLVHLGLGNFHRAHQAWYTAHAPDGPQWGIAAFTGRRPDAADALAPQDGLYTLITRTAEGDTFEVVGAVAAVHPATDHDQLLGYLRRPEVAVITITVTEVGYLLAEDGGLEVTDAVRTDVAALQDDPTRAVTTLPGRLVAGLAARRTAGAGPITVLSCDNLPHNGDVTRTVVTAMADLVDPELSAWIGREVDFASSMVDRITPASTDDDRAEVAERQGYDDAAPVPTEPFSEWVVAGRFPAGRPRWEDAGVTLVEDVVPFEQRKLLLLNGSHSLLAYAGSIRGHASIDQAVADPTCRAWVEQLWDEARPLLSLDDAAVAAYRAALLDRFANPRIRHLLTQIAADGSTKIAVRIVPVLRAERAAGRVPTGAASALAAWVLHLRGQGAPVADPRGDELAALAGGAEIADAVTAVLERIAPDLAADGELRDSVVAQATAITRG